MAATTPFLITSEVAARLRCSLRTVHELTRLGLIPHRRLPARAAVSSALMSWRHGKTVRASRQSTLAPLHESYAPQRVDIANLVPTTAAAPPGDYLSHGGNRTRETFPPTLGQVDESPRPTRRTTRNLEKLARSAVFRPNRGKMAAPAGNAEGRL